MTDQPRLAIPRIQVTMADGRRFEVQALNPDLIAWDRTAAKHHWPSGQQAPFIWLTFLAWKAAVRTEAIDAATTFDDFSERLCIEVRNVSRDAEADDDDSPNGVSDFADPTLPVAELA